MLYSSIVVTDNLPRAAAILLLLPQSKNIDCFQQFIHHRKMVTID
jgi:hypothetical protein